MFLRGEAATATVTSDGFIAARVTAQAIDPNKAADIFSEFHFQVR